jgi:hypothetical protein
MPGNTTNAKADIKRHATWEKARPRRTPACTSQRRTSLNFARRNPSEEPFSAHAASLLLSPQTRRQHARTRAQTKVLSKRSRREFSRPTYALTAAHRIYARASIPSTSPYAGKAPTTPDSRHEPRAAELKPTRSMRTQRGRFPPGRQELGSQRHALTFNAANPSVAEKHGDPDRAPTTKRAPSVSGTRVTTAALGLPSRGRSFPLFGESCAAHRTHQPPQRGGGLSLSGLARFAAQERQRGYKPPNSECLQQLKGVSPAWFSEQLQSDGQRPWPGSRPCSPSSESSARGGGVSRAERTTDRRRWKLQTPGQKRAYKSSGGKGRLHLPNARPLPAEFRGSFSVNGSKSPFSPKPVERLG